MLAILHLVHRHADLCQQGARLRFHAELTQSGAGIVIRHLTREFARLQLHPGHVDEEIGQLEHLGAQPAEAVHQFRVVGKKIAVMRADHAAARTGRHHDVIELFELAQGLLGQIARNAPFARVVRRLPATGLGGRHHHLETSGFDQLDDRKPDLGTHQVDQAGNEQSDSHEPSFGKTSLIIRCLAHNTNGRKA